MSEPKELPWYKKIFGGKKKPNNDHDNASRDVSTDNETVNASVSTDETIFKDILRNSEITSIMNYMDEYNNLTAKYKERGKEKVTTSEKQLPDGTTTYVECRRFYADEKSYEAAESIIRIYNERGLTVDDRAEDTFSKVVLNVEKDAEGNVLAVVENKELTNGFRAYFDSKKSNEKTVNYLNHKGEVNDIVKVNVENIGDKFKAIKKEYINETAKVNVKAVNLEQIGTEKATASYYEEMDGQVLAATGALALLYKKDGDKVVRVNENVEEMLENLAQSTQERTELRKTDEKYYRLQIKNKGKDITIIKNTSDVEQRIDEADIEELKSVASDILEDAKVHTSSLNIAITTDDLRESGYSITNVEKLNDFDTMRVLTKPVEISRDLVQEGLNNSKVPENGDFSR